MTRFHVSLAVVVFVASGCPDAVTSGPLLSLQKRQHDAGCWATMTAQSPVAALGLTDTCPIPAADRRLAASGDLLRLISDYADVRFGSSAAVPPPIVRLTLDGVEIPPGLNTADVQRDGGRVWFASTFPAPSRAARVMTLSVKVADGFAATIPETFTVDAPAVQLEIEQCVGTQSVPCRLIGGAEAAVVNVSVPGETAEDVFLTWTVDGITQTESRTVRADRPALDTVGNRRMAGRASVPAPLARNGTPWVLTARSGASLSHSVEVTLEAPQLQLSVEQCDGGPCRLVAAVDTAVVHVAMPGETVQDVLLTWRINGVTQSETRTIRADQPVVRPDGRRAVTGSGAVPAPSAADSTWSLTGRVGAVTSNTQDISLAAPRLDLIVQQCDGGPCTLVAAVATVGVDVIVEGATPADAELTSRLDGVLQPGSSRLRLERPALLPGGARAVTGTAFVEVPVAADHVLWRIEARARDVTGHAPDITLSTPVPRIGLSCSPTCMLRSGQSTSLAVSAPRGIRVTQANVSTKVDAAPSLNGVVVNLDQVDINAGLVFGELTLVVPTLASDAGVATWQIDATVGPYRATSIFEKISP